MFKCRILCCLQGAGHGIPAGLPLFGTDVLWRLPLRTMYGLFLWTV